MTVVDEKPLLIYLHFSDNSPGDEEKLELSDGKSVDVIWKDVLVEGEYPLTPGANGPIKRRLTVKAEGESSREDNVISMSDIIDAHEDSAFKYVTIPTSHKDQAVENTGYVPRPKGIRVVDKAIEGVQRKVMQCALGFTEPDIKGKVKRGTIPDCSAGIFFDWWNKHKDKRYRSAMKHVALTPTPFMGNLDPFPAVFASDPDIEGDVQVQHFMFDESGTSDQSSGSGDDSNSGNTGEIVWNEEASFQFVRAAIDEHLNPRRPEADADLPIQPRPSYYTRDISREDTALVEEYFKGETKKYIIPFEVKEGAVEIAPATRWVEAREAMIAASDTPAFVNVSTSTVTEKLSTVLASMFGDDAAHFSVAEVSLDSRCRIKNEQTEAEYAAGFTMLSDDSVVIESSAQWERIKAPKEQVQSVESKKVALSDDEPQFDMSTPRGRVAAARHQRQLRRQAR